ncbi:MAG: hypothetical protein QM681_12500 [Novosphingobium sp.]
MTESSPPPLLTFRIEQRRNLAPVWIGASIIATPAATFVAAKAGMGIAALSVPVMIGMCAILLGFLQLRRPATLTLDETGLTFTWLWRVNHWKWPRIDGFRVAYVRSGKAIIFDVYEEDGLSVAAVPAVFEIDERGCVAILQRVRRMMND